MTNTEDSGDNNPYFGTVKDIPAEADLYIKTYYFFIFLIAQEISPANAATPVTILP